MALTTDTTPIFIHTMSLNYSPAAMFPGYAIATSVASGGWPVANQAFYIPLLLPFAYTAQRIWWFNGAAVAGNVDCAIYNQTFTKVVGSGAVAQAGTNTIQYATISQSLAAGSYYLGLSLSSAAGTIFQSVALPPLNFRIGGILEQATANPLPNPMVPVTATHSVWPLFGITRTTSGF